MNFKIRKARLSDAEDLAKLYIQFWDVHSNLDPLIELKEKPTLKNQITSAKKEIKKKNMHTFVAVENNQVIGFIELIIKKNDKMFKIKEYGYLNSAVTHKNFRGKGVAKALTKECITFCMKKGIKYLKGTVYNENEAAMKAWTKLGLKPQSQILFKKI